MDSIEFLKDTQKTEEIQDIIEKMPTKFGAIITLLICGILSIMVFFGIIIRYPDIVTGNLVVNTAIAPVKLISESNGRLRLNSISSQQGVSEGQIVAWIENTTTPYEINWLKSTLDKIKLPIQTANKIYIDLPKNRSLGQLTPLYGELLLALKALADQQENKLMSGQISTVQNILAEENKSKQIIALQKINSLKSLGLTENFFKRDSILFSKKVISASEYDKSIMTKLGAISQHQQLLKEFAGAQERINNTQKIIREIEIQKVESDHALVLKINSLKNIIQEQIAEWEKKYLLKAPFSGKIQFLGFLQDKEFVQSGQAIFSVIPKNTQLTGQVILPSQGAGKVKIGQEVIVKLDNYPYMEYGSVRGKVHNISLTTNTKSTPEGPIETYMVEVQLPNGLKTNYGSELNFKSEIRGTAEIVTKDRAFIERFFENLKYGANK